jgi:hypothetical protein
LCGKLAATLLVGMFAACDPDEPPNDSSTSSSVETDPSSGTSSSDESLLPACVEWVNGQGGDSAEEECAQWLSTKCTADNEDACVQTSLGSTGTDVAIRCVWYDLWRGAAESVCEDGTLSSGCVGSSNVGEVDPSGPFFRSFAEEVWIANHLGSDTPVGYNKCNMSMSPPTACECLASE